MAEAAVSFTLAKLTDLAIQTVSSLLGVGQQVTDLSDELKRMQSFLRDAAEKQYSHKYSEYIREWISQIRDVAHDSEDAIENFALKVACTPRSLRWTPRYLHNLDKLGKQVKAIQERLSDIEKSRERYGIKNIDEGLLKRNSVEQRRRLYPWETDKHVMGLEDAVKTLIPKVVSGGEGLKVVSIVGMGGSGKSTLAREVYNSLEVRKRFGLRRAWVCVTREFNPKEVMREVVKQLVGPNEAEDIEKLPESDVRKMVHKKLSGRSYFVVVDDVWRPEHWECLFKAFPDEQGKAGRLLVTSRNSKIPSGAKYVHEHNGLDSDKSRQLLLKTALVNNNDGKFPLELEDVGTKLLGKCNGLPLAIRVVGGLLQEEGQSKIGWEKVLKGMSSNFGINDDDPVMSILELSYHDLPPHLKSCFLCLSFFKEDAAIPARDLTLIWIAEGFVPGEAIGEKLTMEEIARNYLHDLINRNMIQVKDCGKDSTEVLNCQVHDLLHDLSIRKAREEIRFEVLNEPKDSKELDYCRHCVMYYNDENLKSFDKNPHLRSLFLHKVSKGNDIPFNFWKSFEILRLLNLEGFGLETLPKSIRKMVSLRYLGLRNNKLKKLPKAIGQLKNLQHLDLAGNSKMKVPNIICNLEGLRHLFMDWDISCKKPLRLDTLKKLQTLSIVSTNNIVVEHLAELASLCKLGVRLGEGFETTKLFASMAKLKNFVSIHIILRDGSSFSTDGLGSSVFLARLKITYFVRKLTDLPQNLSYVSLIKTWVEEDPIPVLEKLPNLVYLKLDDALALTQVRAVISQQGFPMLEEIYLLNLLKLVTIHIEDGGMKELKRLKIFNCERLKILPETEEMRLMRNLQELKMLRVSSENKKKFDDERYSDILSRIPSVEISPIKY